MRISDVQGPVGIDPTSSAGRRANAKGSSESGSDEADEVRLSAKGIALSQAGDGDIDTAKVARLRAALDGGTFRVDARVIAERLARGG